MELTTLISELNRVGKTMAARLKALDLNTAEDLLFYLPFRYDDFSQSVLIKDLRPNSRANLVGEIELINNKRSFKRRLAITEALISDESGAVKAVWFNQPFLVKNLHVGDKVSLSGKVEEEYGQAIMVSPVYEKVHLTPNPSPIRLTLRAGSCEGEGHSSVAGKAVHTQGLVPNYSLTADLTQKQIRFLISQVMVLTDRLVDYLPAALRQSQGLPALGEALRHIHFPKNLPQAEAARQRLAFDELLFLQLRVLAAKNNLKNFSAYPLMFHEAATKALVDSLPFKLTNDQRRAAWEIIKDIALAKPMTRLLEGDVGSGKTVVAVLAMYNAVLNHKQAVLLAPTEILARQHFNSISKLLADTNLKVGLITRTEKQINPNSAVRPPTSERQLKRIKKVKKLSIDCIIQNTDLIIGTHALLQAKINFQALGLVVVDEQHRFGVEQRQTLVRPAQATQVPHLLSMTATPIPRSLALALYDDLALSIIKEQPSGRLPVITKIFAEAERLRAYEFMRQEIRQGRQAFVICPLIDPSDKLGAKSATAEYDYLQSDIFPEFKLGLLHGKLKPTDKEKIMAEFAGGATDILVATAVVEVGIDVPNATVMLIESADRFGLAQLHQYRGRVGRGSEQSYCLLSEGESADKANERLAMMLRFNNGFDLAQADLKFRGPGEVYGTLQKGFTDLKIANLFDVALIRQAKNSAQELLAESPDLVKFPALKAKLGEWENLIHFE